MRFKLLSIALISGLYASGQSLGSFTPASGTAVNSASVFIGDNSGEFWSSAGDNSFVGRHSGRGQSTALNSGTGNCFFGRSSGDRNTTGSSNCFMGAFSGQFNGAGNSNVMLGFGSGSNRVSSLSNTFVGTQSGLGLSGDGTVVSNNSFIGFQTGMRTTGSNNTFLGARSMTGAGNGSGNTVIGANLNLFLNATNTVILGHGGGDQWGSGVRLFIDENGNGGLGTTTPQNRLDVEGGVAIGAGYSGTNVAPVNGLLVQGNTGFGTTAPGNRVQITTGTLGNSGLRLNNLVGSSLVPNTAGGVLSINGAGDVVLVADQTSGSTPNNPTGITNSCNGASSVNFITKTADALGNLRCSSIYDDGNGHVGFGFGSSPNTTVNVSINGSQLIAGGSSYITSDRKFKTDIAPISNALETIMKIDGKTYNWKNSEFKEINFSNETQFGFIAQDVQKILPNIVLQSENGDLAMNYIAMIPILVEALKQQQAQIEDLKLQIAENFKTQNAELIGLEITKIISVSPNPSKDVITVFMNIDKSVVDAKLFVHDINGKLLSSLSINERDNNVGKTFQKDNFGAGVYIVSLSVNGKSIDSKKIVFN